MSERRYRLNGQAHGFDGPARARLLDILRGDHGLMAAKPGCGIGRCGACLVLVDGRPANACLVMGYRLDDVEIVTAEGLAALPEAEVVRDALIAANAFQCGYCAPGVTVSLVALLRRDPDADEAALRAALSGNLCRCTGYASILRGGLEAVDRLRSARQPPMTPSPSIPSPRTRSRGTNAIGMPARVRVPRSIHPVCRTGTEAPE